MNRVGSATLGTSDTVVFTADTHMEDCSLIVVNNSGAARTFQLHHVPNGSSSADVNLIATKGFALAADGTPPKYKEFALSPGESIRGLCDSADGVTVTVYGRAI